MWGPDRSCQDHIGGAGARLVQGPFHPQAPLTTPRPRLVADRRSARCQMKRRVTRTPPEPAHPRTDRTVLPARRVKNPVCRPGRASFWMLIRLTHDRIGPIHLQASLPRCRPQTANLARLISSQYGNRPTGHEPSCTGYASNCHPCHIQPASPEATGRTSGGTLGRSHLLLHRLRATRRPPRAPTLESLTSCAEPKEGDPCSTTAVM